MKKISLAALIFSLTTAAFVSNAFACPDSNAPSTTTTSKQKSVTVPAVSATSSDYSANAKTK